MSAFRTYTISRERRLSGQQSMSDASFEQRIADVSREEVAEAAQERANREHENIIITATHWPEVPLGSGSRNRFSGVRVCPGDSLDDIVEQIRKVESR